MYYHHLLSFQIRLRPHARQSPHLSHLLLSAHLYTCSPSLHLQLISALGSVYLYLSTITCSSRDCLVCFCQAFPRLYVYRKPDYPVFRPWNVSWIPYTLPAPRRICLLNGLISRFWPCLPVPRIQITLPAPLLNCLYTGLMSRFWPCFGITK